MTPRIAAAVLSAVLVATAVQAQAADPKPTQSAPATPSAEASIPFASHGGIDDWYADSDHSLYVRSRAGKWYHATLMGPCLDLRFVNAIGFVTRPGDTFDRFSSVRVRGKNCVLTSLVPSGPPPVKARKKNAIVPVEPAQPSPPAK